MPETINYVGIYVALVERVSKEYDGQAGARKDYHPHERHHWHLLIEREGYPRDWRTWQQCHTIETSAWQRLEGDRSLPEDFEDFPFVTSAKSLRLVPHSLIRIASINVGKREFLIEKLENLSSLVDKQRRCEETCRGFIKGVLCYLQLNSYHFGIAYLDMPPTLGRPDGNFHRLVRTYVELGLIEDHPPEKPSTPLPPSPTSQRKDALSRLKSKKSIFGIKPSGAGISDSSASDRKASAQSVRISRPQPLDPSQYPASNAQIHNRPSRREMKFPPVRSSSEGATGTRMLGFGSLAEWTESRSRSVPRRASETPQSYRQRMAESLGNMVKRNSAPS